MVFTATLDAATGTYTMNGVSGLNKQDAITLAMYGYGATVVFA
jgi:hypothetical protein